MEWTPSRRADVASKRSQGWVKCEDRLPYYRYTRPQLHDSRGPRGSRRGRGRPGQRARSSGALGASMQREGAVPDSFVQKNVTRIASLD